MSEPLTVSAEDYLRRPYARVLIPDDESGTWTARILEFPGCVTQGNNAGEALARLEKAAQSWIEAALEMGQDIPPARASLYSGKVALRLPKGLHCDAARTAELEGTSLNQFIVTAVAERIGATTLYHRLTTNPSTTLRLGLRAGHDLAAREDDS